MTEQVGDAQCDAPERLYVAREQDLAYMRILEVLCGCTPDARVTQEVLRQIAAVLDVPRAALVVQPLPGLEAVSAVIDTNEGTGRDVSATGRVKDLVGEVSLDGLERTEHGSRWTGPDLNGWQVGSGPLLGECACVALVPLHGRLEQLGWLGVGSPDAGCLDRSRVAFVERAGGKVSDCLQQAAGRDNDLLRHPRLAQEFQVAAAELAAAMAHDLKTPLAGISLSAERLRRGLSSPERQKRVPGIVEHLLTAVGMLNDRIADTSERLNSVPLRRQAIVVRSLMDDALTAFAGRLAEQNVDVTRDYRCDATVEGDPELLQRAIANLVLNALEAMPEGGVLRLLAQSEDRGMVLVEVQDTGSGLEPSTAGSMTKPFVTTKSGHLGWGLPMARRIALLHGGALELLPGDECGARVQIRLPQAGSQHFRIG